MDLYYFLCGEKKKGDLRNFNKLDRRNYEMYFLRPFDEKDNN